jgi:hypothetical protein
LLADGDIEGIQNLAGYGVITWIDSNNRDRIYLARLSTHSDIVLVSIKGGGFVWASTKRILNEALKFADLEADEEYDLSEIGRVFQISASGVFRTTLDGVKVGNYNKWKGKSSPSSYDSFDSKQSENIDHTVPVASKSFNDETYSSGYHGGYMSLGEYYGGL